MMMIVYFFAVIGVIALVHFLIGWAFADLNDVQQTPSFDWKALWASEKAHDDAVAGHYETNDFEEQMKAHRRGHERG